ncbi:MAG: hypothetical protein Q8M29_18580 [Bacteroidota bacterium]|nr:hypothetical protein [Bacteroidota bacterium]
MKTVAFLLLFINILHGQTLKNGKFHCLIDTSKFYEKEEWTLTLLEVNMVELISVKSSDINRSPIKTQIRQVKNQFYTGYWTQKGDTILIGLDSNSDSMEINEDYQLKFLRKGNNLILIKSLQLKNFDYSDFFYEKSVWVKKRYRQRSKPKVRAKF